MPFPESSLPCDLSRYTPAGMKRLVILVALALTTYAISAFPPPPYPLASTRPADEALPTLWIVGDSTVRKGDKTQQMIGWGDAITPLFDTTKVNVANRGQGGESTRTYLYSKRWAAVMRDAKAGDFVIVQFGHNDSAAIDTPREMRGTLSGTGEQTHYLFNDVVNENETVHTYGWYLRKMINEAKAKGMTMIICSPVPRCPTNDHAEPTEEARHYQSWARDVAEAENVPFIDLFSVIWKYYSAEPAAAVKAKYFTKNDNTHTNPDGAKLNAACVAEGLKLLQNDPLAAYLK